MIYLLRLLSRLTLRTALSSASAASLWNLYQPTLPDELK